MYKNIIFDLGGVVIDYEPREFLVDHFMNEKVEDALYDITFGSDEWRLLDAGLITREKANEAMREKGVAMGRAFEVNVILEDWFDMLRTKEDTVALMKRLKSRGYGLFYLSDVPWDVYTMLQQRRFWKLFDGGIASCEIQLTKPDPRIYHVLLRRYGLSATECIFVDDNRGNTEAASARDITGIHFTSVRALQHALRDLGVDSEKKSRIRPVSPPSPTGSSRA